MFADYMINAWIATSLVAVAAGMVGFFVVVRGAAFAAHALPLGAFPGLAAAWLLGIAPWSLILAFAGLGAFGLARSGEKAPHHTATALWLVSMLALGNLLLSRMHAYSNAVFAVLFGEVLGVSNTQVLAVAAIVAVTVIAMALLYRPLLLSTLSPDLAAAAALPERRIATLFLLIVALVTSAALPLVGASIVFSLMVGPASAARLMTDRPGWALGLSVLLALSTVWSALALAYEADWPIGAFVGVMGAVWYGVGRIVRWQSGRLRRG
ncbi:metal ABC transporter permease [Jiella sp. MQZ9-1]|uniref:Metal ABC transporter permease n=1 Tax=Jiella flava TaxID=2816857 RepID=A0A939JVH2_9HYPH|nr:metal ABC transporter permease [Jiella flava]MBO0661972.1 metal ABC transporter permease [Jiella flava]MCD2470701.1 metal ABC transporter permease [Jiella flava]